MRGNLAAVVLLLTVALLSDDDRPSAAPPTSDIQEETFCDVFRVSRRRVERTSSSSWFPGARASPLGRLENRPLPQEIINIDIDDLSPKEEPALDESSSRSTESEWRPSKNDTQLMNDLHGGQWSLPGGSNVPMGWADPRLRGGRMLDFTLPHRGEPLNAIISGLSDPYILTTRGLLHYAQSLGFSSECLGLHIGQLHIADLGDSMRIVETSAHTSQNNTDMDETHPDPFPHEGGNKTEQLLARQNFDWPLYGWPDYGTCWESLVGGNHFRAWKQDGAGARTGAWFLAVSQELWLGAHHDIAPNGYNGGRDALVARAQKPTRWSPTQEGVWWTTDVTWNTTLLAPGKDGINHGISQDGRVAILTVRRRQGPPTISELEAAWREVATNTTSSDPGVRIESRRGQWELGIGRYGDNNEGEIIRIEEQKRSSSRWRSLFGMIYWTWSLPHGS